MNAFKWNMDLQYSPLFGLLCPGDVVHFDNSDVVRKEVAEVWVQRGVAEWVEDDKETKKPTKGKGIKEG